MSTHAPCRLAADIGGTFTDVVLEAGESLRTSAKVLTTAQAPEEGLMTGIARLLDQTGRSPRDLNIIIHGTTLATNALIERTGARTALVTTEGFRDVVDMGFEKRYAHYELDAPAPEPLVPRPLRFSVPERKRATGETLVALDEDAVADTAGTLRELQVEAVAIGFLHAYAYPEHEQRAAEILTRELPDVCLSLSSEVCPEMREYERISTTCANAYVQPLMVGYLARLRDRLAVMGVNCPLYLMMSGGGLTTLEQAMACPIRLVESGPAGGAILAADIAAARGIDKALAFDMGGTTAKICLIANARPDRNRSFEVARVYRDRKGSGLPVRVPVIEMVEIGAGGGSIAQVDAMGRIKVGPQSAGADPGPVAYARGGTRATVTDANVALGKIDPRRFAGGSFELDAQAAARALAADIGAPLELGEHWPAAGVAEIVEENMANAARVHAIERGREASEHTMIAFGGGAPLHAAYLARKLGISRVVVPAGAGVGSAIGFLRAPVSFQIVRSFRVVLDDADLASVNALLDSLSEQARTVVRAGAVGIAIDEERLVELRYCGQGHELAVGLPGHALCGADRDTIRRDFERTYERVYGLTMPDVPIEAVSWSITASTKVEPAPRIGAMPRSNVGPAGNTRTMYDPFSGSMVEAAVHQRCALCAGATIEGPALVVEDETTTVVPGGVSATVDAGGALVLEIALPDRPR
ncbi:MAG: hydantoinase/oxoprolinase family protein [Gammaproteobacteria bacterium]